MRSTGQYEGSEAHKLVAGSTGGSLGMQRSVWRNVERLVALVDNARKSVVEMREKAEALVDAVVPLFLAGPSATWCRWFPGVPEERPKVPARAHSKHIGRREVPVLIQLECFEIGRAHV